LSRFEIRWRFWLADLARKLWGCREGVLPVHLQFVLSCVGDFLYGWAKGIKSCCILHFVKNRCWQEYRGRRMPDYDVEPAGGWISEPPEHWYIPCRKHRGAAKYFVFVLED
jgi:hypothetical protein